MRKILKAGLLMAAIVAASGVQAMPRAPLAVESNANIVRVQSVNPELQIQQLQETIRDLNGRVEELNFQLLQMQEQMRKMQEDNEFRFQELEKGKQSGSLEQPAIGEDSVDTAGATAPASQQDVFAASENNDSDIAIENETAETGQEQGIQPGTLGSLIFNNDGELVETNRQDNEDAGTLPGVDTPEIATGGGQDFSGQTESDAYQTAYSLILSGDYAQAEQSFKGFLDAYPEGTQAADAAFWLGEAQYSQGKYKDAAETFLNTYKAYGTSPKAPEVLLKLGMSLAELDNRETACATLREIPKRFPKASKIVITKVATEQGRLGC